MDENTSVPISYANIWKQKKIIAATDSMGYFQSIPNYNDYLITAIGYKDKQVLDLPNTIFLEPKIIELETVMISNPKFLKIKEYGKAAKGKTVGVNFDAEVSQLIKFIPNKTTDEEQQFIKSISFYTNATSKNRKINIVFYSVGKDGKPNEIVNNENLILHLKIGTTLNTVDLRSFKLNFPPEGLFVGIQHLLIEDNKNYAQENGYDANVFCFEPFLYVTENPKIKDSWNLIGGVWKTNERFSLNLKIEISD